jgi:hypothetical protein
MMQELDTGEGACTAGILGKPPMLQEAIHTAGAATLQEHNSQVFFLPLQCLSITLY